ncbi:MAG TPA: hypothetical protein VFR17_05400, partial [Mycobacterium sp.]|nr:hypothetical protein [Mycobacterium sp.]
PDSTAAPAATIVNRRGIVFAEPETLSTSFIRTYLILNVGGDVQKRDVSVVLDQISGARGTATTCS